MDLANASDESITQSYRHLIELQEDVTTLDSEANGADELESLIAELSHFHSEFQKVRRKSTTLVVG